MKRMHLAIIVALCVHTASFFIPTQSKITPSSTVVVNNSKPLSSHSLLICSGFVSKSFSTSTLLSKRPTHRTHSHSVLLFSLLLLSGDLELNPGPVFKFPCGDCSRPCKSNQAAIQCDSCDTWYHKKCLSMNSQIFKTLSNSSATWICCQCGLPNFSQDLFNSNPLQCQNSFNPLQSLSGGTPPSSFRPTQASTPIKKPSQPKFKKKPQFRPSKCQPSSVKENKGVNNQPKNKNLLSTLLINFRSLPGKKHFVNALLDDLSETHSMDILFGTETWLNEDILNSELNLPDYHIYRRDRTDREGGGVFLCIKKSLNSVLVHKSKTSESIFAKINVPGKPPPYSWLRLQIP